MTTERVRSATLGPLDTQYAVEEVRECYGFAEGFTALALQRQGFTCWTGVHLFGRRPVNAERRLKNTEAVEGLLKWSEFELPQELRRAAKNPDIVAYNTRRKEWRFCEVKRGETVQRGQVIGLAILHLLTGAPVAIVRLVHKKDFTPREHRAHFRLKAPIRFSFMPVRLEGLDVASHRTAQALDAKRRVLSG